MLSAEDDYPSILVPRLMKQGANLANIAVPDKQFVLDSAGINQLAAMMAQFAATMVFIDPIVYYAGGKMDMNKSNEVRSMMEKLKEAAEAVKSSVVIVGHIRKSQEGGDGDMMMGSADWINAARSSLFVTKTNDGTKILKHTKTNYGEIGLARSYHIDHDGLHWDEVYDEDDLPTEHPASKSDVAESFLRTLLKDGPAPATEVFAGAKDNGISVATLNRVKPRVAESFYSRSAQTMLWKLKD
jgi:putative DNA primase/helicase